MGECLYCGEEDLTFTCRYCGGSFCSEHRLPENHDCPEIEKAEKGSAEKQEADTKKREPAVYRTHRQSLTRDLISTLAGSITLLIIGITTFSYLLQMTLPGFQELLILDTDLQEILARPWSILTVILLHGPPFHIIANMLTFYFFANPIEKMLGGLQMLKIYLISALAGSLAMIAFNNTVSLLHGGEAGLVVGASAGVVGLVGVIARLYPNADVLMFFVIPMKIKTAVYGFGAFELLNVALTLAGVQILFLPIEFFASAGHLGGLIAGLIIGEKIRQKVQTRGPFNPLQV